MTQIELAVRRPSSVDVHVGGRVRVRRRLLAMTQERLAELIDVTFQQVQKYERGSNRISASKLFAIAAALEAPINYFFEGLDGEPSSTEAPPSPERTIHAFLQTPEGIELAQAFPRIGRGPLRRRVLELVRAAVDEDRSDDA
jgi:transcriptional regulator with XRE-family HTH domain